MEAMEKRIQIMEAAITKKRTKQQSRDALVKCGVMSKSGEIMRPYTCVLKRVTK